MGDAESINRMKIKEQVEIYAAECNLKVIRCDRAKGGLGQFLTKIYIDLVILDAQSPYILARYPWHKLVKIQMPETTNVIYVKFKRIEAPEGDYHPLEDIGVCPSCGFPMGGACSCAAPGVGKKRKYKPSKAADAALARLMGL